MDGGREERRLGGRVGGKERGRKGEWILPIVEIWLRHCTALSVCRFYFDAF